MVPQVDTLDSEPMPHAADSVEIQADPRSKKHANLPASRPEKKRRIRRLPLGLPRIKRSPELANQIIALVADGKSIRQISESLKISPWFVNEWLRTDADFQNNYARAKQQMADAMFDEIVALADTEGLTTDEITQLRIRVDVRKWALAHLNAKKYGDRPNELHLEQHVHNHVSAEQQQEWQRRRLESLERMRLTNATVIDVEESK